MQDDVTCSEQKTPRGSHGIAICQIVARLLPCRKWTNSDSIAMKRMEGFADLRVESYLEDEALPPSIESMLLSGGDRITGSLRFSDVSSTAQPSSRAVQSAYT